MAHHLDGGGLPDGCLHSEPSKRVLCGGCLQKHPQFARPPRAMEGPKLLSAVPAQEGARHMIDASHANVGDGLGCTRCCRREGALDADTSANPPPPPLPPLPTRPLLSGNPP